jgi:hypothetical protein
MYRPSTGNAKSRKAGNKNDPNKNDPNVDNPVTILMK